MSSSSSLSLEERIADLEAKRDREETARDKALAIGDLMTANACRMEIGGFASLLAELKAEARLARPVISVSQRLTDMHVAYQDDDLRYLRNHDPSRYLMLESSPDLTQETAYLYICNARSRVKSATRQVIGKVHDIMIDGVVSSSGQTKSSIYFAYTISGGVVAAKVFYKDEDAYQREIDIRSAIGNHHHIVNFLKTFSLPSQQKFVIVMDYYPRSAHDLQLQYSQQNPVPQATLRSIIAGSGSALRHIHSRGYCFGDMKPSNIMLERGEQGKAVLIDFGAAVRFDEDVVEYSKIYCLDADVSVGSKELDWVCLATTVAEIASVDISKFNTRVILLNQIEFSERFQDSIKAFLKACLAADPSVQLIHETLELI